MARRGKTYLGAEKTPFNIDCAVKRALKLMQGVIDQLEEEGKIPSQPTRPRHPSAPVPKPQE